MNCPKCNVTLVMSDRQGVEIDYCPTCRGVWLDRGELDKIIDRSMTPQGQPNFNPHNDMHDSYDNYKRGDHNQHEYNKHRKKGWLGELFD